MGSAKNLKNQEFDAANYLEARLGSLPLQRDLWEPRVNQLARAGIVDPEVLLCVFFGMKLKQLSRTRQIYRSCKRVTDLLFCLWTLPLLSPVFLLIAIAIKLESRGPVFFTQTRTGFLGLPFEILKFRTMFEESPAALGNMQSDRNGPFFKVHQDPRVTRVGWFLRRWSLDELPQLVNILLGDMTLIGPRPLPVYDVAGIPFEFMDRFSVKPGLTGLWQVTARDSADGIVNLMIDQDYVKRFGPLIDLKIMLKTPGVVLSGIGAR